MLRLFVLRKAFRVGGISAGLLLSAAITSHSASAQLVLGFQNHDDPYIMCKVYVTGSNVRLGSGETANTREAGDRFGYYAKKWAEETGNKINYDCERYERITDEWRARWEVGSSFVNDDGETITIEKAPFLPDNWASTPTPEEKEKLASENVKTNVAAKDSGGGSEPGKKSAAQIAAEEAAARKAKYEAEFQAKQAEYERKLAEQQQQVEDFKRAQEEVERTRAANQAKADAAAAAFKAEQEAYAESVRHNEAQQEAAKKLMADWDARHGLKAKASTDTDANQCVTQAETQLNASFKGNTAASIINGCGQTVDVRICLMTSTKGWNCGVSYGVGSQEKWSWSSFDATGPVFVDARISGSSRPLASPQ